MSLESIFTSDQLDALIQAPLDVAVLAAEADFELEDIELQELETQLTTYEGNEYVKELFLSAKSLLDKEFSYSLSLEIICLTWMRFYLLPLNTTNVSQSLNVHC